METKIKYPHFWYDEKAGCYSGLIHPDTLRQLREWWMRDAISGIVEAIQFRINRIANA